MGLTTFFNIISEGSDNAVTAIMKLRAVPMPTPFVTRASAMGNVPKISAYMGIPTSVAKKDRIPLVLSKKGANNILWNPIMDERSNSDAY